MLCYISNFWPQKLGPPLTKSQICTCLDIFQKTSYLGISSSTSKQNLLLHLSYGIAAYIFKVINQISFNKKHFVVVYNILTMIINKSLTGRYLSNCWLSRYFSQQVLWVHFLRLFAWVHFPTPAIWVFLPALVN